MSETEVMPTGMALLLPSLGSTTLRYPEQAVPGSASSTQHHLLELLRDPSHLWSALLLHANGET